jgi:hypothetical protein
MGCLVNLETRMYKTTQYENWWNWTRRSLSTNAMNMQQTNTESEKILKSDVQSYERSKANKINFYFVTLHDMSILHSEPQARYKTIHVLAKIIPSVKLQYMLYLNYTWQVAAITIFHRNSQLEFWHSEDRALCYILIIKTNDMHYFSNLFWYRTPHVSDRFTVRHQKSNTVYTATGKKRKRCTVRWRGRDFASRQSA